MTVECWRVVSVDTGRPTTRNWTYNPLVALRRLHDAIADHPGEDFVIVDPAGRPVPSSRLQEALPRYDRPAGEDWG